MKWDFNNIHDMKKFAKYLSEQLKTDGHEYWANEADFYSTNAFTTTSEYFGELRTFLKTILAHNIICK